MTFRIRPLFCLGLLLFGSTCWSPAQEVVSGIFGFSKLDMLGASDTFVSMPFARLADSSALVSSTSSSNIIQVQGAPGWTVDKFVFVSGVQSNSYYVRIESGALEGRYFNITSNTTNALTVNLNGGSLTGLATNNQVSVIPHWTLAVVFGPDGNGIVPSTGTSVPTRKTEVYLPNFNVSGINIAAGGYYFLASGGSNVWRKTSGPATNSNDDIIRPNSYFFIRHRNVATNTTFVSLGDVLLTKAVIPLVVNATNKQDNFISMPRPLELSLNDAGLIASGAFVASTGTSVPLRKDELYVFDNTTTNLFKSGGTPYYFLSTDSSWRKVGGTSTNYATSNIFLPGGGYFIRKAAAAVTPVWTNSPTYTNN